MGWVEKAWFKCKAKNEKTRYVAVYNNAGYRCYTGTCEVTGGTYKESQVWMGPGDVNLDCKLGDGGKFDGNWPVTKASVIVGQIYESWNPKYVGMVGEYPDPGEWVDDCITESKCKFEASCKNFHSDYCKGSYWQQRSKWCSNPPRGIDHDGWGCSKHRMDWEHADEVLAEISSEEWRCRDRKGARLANESRTS